MLTFKRHLATTFVATLSLFISKPASAQLTFQACSQGTLVNCADIRLTTQLGVGAGGTNLLEIALRNLGSTTSPNLATSLYFLSFSTGLAAVPAGSEIDASVRPVATGGATISDASPWDFLETGDAIALSALGNNGIGGCAMSSLRQHVGCRRAYGDDGGGLFFVGLEGNGVVYVYALNHTTNGFKQITSFSTSPVYCVSLIR